MTNLHEMLDLFNPILTYYHNEPSNVVIGGYYALIQHGLFIGREPEDLDVIIYKPTEKQMSVLAVQSVFQINTKISFGDPDMVGINKKSWKFKKKDCILNILLEKNKNTPEDLLLFRHGSHIYQIQNINNVIDAKNSYLFHDDIGNPRYSRIKDAKDLENLKKYNFNLPNAITISDEITDNYNQSNNETKFNRNKQL